MATFTAMSASKIRGGSFLIEERTPGDVFTPEDFSEQHQLIAQTAEEFANKEIVPITLIGKEAGRQRLSGAKHKI